MNFYEEELIVRRLGVRCRAHPKGHVYVNQRRESDSLIFVVEGELEISTPKESRRVRTGECIYLPEGTSTRSFHLAEYNKTINFFFNICEGALSEGVATFPHNELALSLMSELYGELLHTAALDTNYLRAIFYKLVYQLTSRGTVERKHLKIHSLMLELETRYAENLPISDYARRYFMSESSLRSQFRRYTGRSVIEYRNLVRLRRAEELIRDGMRVGEAALTVGFSSVSFYCRLVRKYSGC